MLSPRHLITYILSSFTAAAALVVYGNFTNIPTTVDSASPTAQADSISQADSVGEVDSPVQSAIPLAPAALSPSLRQQNSTESVLSIHKEHADNWRLATAGEIPFPIYPNGTRYRIGGKNGMKLALFETTDDFNTVAAYYDSQARVSGLSRQMLTLDYVQYSQPESASTDTWKVAEDGNSPGVVVHEFFDAEEAENLGADPQSRTNIIISFR